MSHTYLFFLRRARRPARFGTPPLCGLLEWAMAGSPRLYDDVVDSDGGVILSVTLCPPILFLALLLKYQDFLGPVVFDDSALDFGISDQRTTGLDLAAVLDEQYIRKLHFGADFARQFFEPNRLSWRYPVLFPA
jgi:hypothetical protein